MLPNTKHHQGVRKTRHLQLFFSALFLFTAGNTFGQTPGLIYDPATGSGPAVLDPNGDGYTSQSDVGYTTNDQSESELAYTPFIFPSDELPNDLTSGPNCGFTDFVDEGFNDPALKYFDASNNWLFRMRLGSSASASKSYSILIDTDYKFGNSGIYADPDFTPDNPGFEIEIVMATNFGVFVYDVSSASPSCSPVISYPGHDNYQKSIALSNSCGDMDFFYDFYVPFSALASQFGITTSTPLRYVVVDNMAANKSSVCNPNSISDIAGLGFCTNLAVCYQTVIDPQGGCSASQSVCLNVSSCPSIGTSLIEGVTTISGTSTEADGTTIKVYNNGSVVATTTVSSGNWTVTGITPALAAFDTIFVTATAAGKAESNYDCNYDLVTSATCTPMVTALDICNSGKALQGYATPGSVINLYYGISGTALTPSSGYNYTPGTITAGTVPSTLSITTDNWLWKCVGSGQSNSCTSGGAPCLGDGAYRVSATLPGMCESQPVWFCLGSSGPTATPTITTTNLTSSSTSVSGTIAAPDNVAGAFIVLYVNSNWVGTATTTAGGAWTVNSLTLHGCDTVKVFAINGTKCLSNASNSVVVTNGPTAAPQITGTYCTLTNITSVTGTSSEPDGTSIQVYDNGIAEGSATTVTNGVWSISTGINVSPGSTITAKATATCKSQSVASTGVTVGLQTTDASLAITTTPIFEQATSVSGTATAGNTVQLYIDGYPVGSSVVSTGTWTVSGLTTYDIYYLGEITATSTSTTGCASAPSASADVQCILPTISLTVNPDSFVACAGNTSAVNVFVVNSESGIVYQLFNGASNTGSSKLGNNGTLTLTSLPLSTSTTLKVKAIKIPPLCTTDLTDSVAVVFNPNPTLSLTLGATTNPTCEGIPTNITIANSEVGFTYQLRNNANNALVGTAVAGTGGTINLSTGALASATTFNVLVTGIAPSNCSGQLASTITINILPAPAVPTASSPQAFCSSTNPTVTNLVATGTGIQWYAASSGGSPLTSSTTLVNGSVYYAAQTSGGGCQSLSRVAVTVSITTAPAATISYAGTPFCKSLATPQSVSLTGTSGGTFSSTAGLSINASTGAITPSTSTAGSYTVTYTIAASGACPIFNTTANVTITAAPNATISYSGSPFCSTDAPESVTLTGTSGGTFSSSAGLALNATTGAINPIASTTGTYTVNYDIAAAAGCAAFNTTASVTITQAPSATVSYDGSPYCATVATPQAPTFTGTSGGTFSANPAGLSLNSSTGAIVPSTSTPGTYTVTYSVAAAGGCNIYTTTAMVTVSTGYAATISYTTTPFCTSEALQSVTLTGDVGGTFSSTSGLTIDSNSGAIDPSTSTPGTYTIDYNIPASGGCVAFNTSTSVSINATPVISLATSNSPVCFDNTLDLSVTASGTPTYSWNGPNGFTSTSQTPTVSNADASDAGTYTVTATENGCTSTPATVNVVTQDCYPVANVDTVTMTHNTSVNITVISNDTDPQNNLNASSITITSNPTNGVTTVGVGGIISYTPATNYFGSDTFIYQICDNTTPTPFCDTALVVINVVFVNTAPVVSDSTVTTSEDTPITVCLQINDPDVLQNFTVTSCGASSNGLVGTSIIGSQVCVTYTPNTNFNGTDAFCITICDNYGTPACDNALITVNVTSVNDDPEIINDTTITTTEDDTITICIPIVDADSSQNYSVSACGNPVNGSVTTSINNNQLCVVYIPDPDFYGTDSICLIVCDDGVPAGCDTVTIIIDVTPVNDAPVVSDSSVITSEDTPITVCLPITDGETNQSYTVASCGNPLNGNATTGISGNQVCVTYTPNSAFNGIDSLCIIICDNGAPTRCDTAMVYITVAPINNAPTVNDTTVTTTEDTPVTVCIPINDVDAGQTYTVSSCGLPQNGTASSTISGNQLCITYTPNADFNGTDNLCVVVCDNGFPQGCDTALVVINVSPVNDPPVIAINDTTYTTPEDSAITICLTVVDQDTAQTYTTTSCGDPANGSSTTVVNGNDVCITYTPDPNFNGTDSICVIVCDADGGCDTATVIIDVTPTNNVPFVNDSTVTTPEETPITLCLGIVDPDNGQIYSVSSCGNPTNGSSSAGISGNQVCVTYTPNQDFFGLDSLCIIVCDDGSPTGCDTAIVYINVTPTNDEPVVNDTTVTTTEDTQITVCLPIADGETNQTYTVSSCGDPMNGTSNAVVTGNQVCITYTPNGSFNGLDSLCIIVCDNGTPTACDTATVYINVTPINNTPSVSDTNITVLEDSVVTICLPILDIDAGQTYTVSSCGDPIYGTATSVINGNQVCITYTPNPDYNGTDNLCIVVCDDGNPVGCDTAIISIDVTPVNDAPIVNDSTVTTLENTAVTVCLPILDVDAGQTFTASSCGDPLNGTATFVVTGNQVCVTYTPNTNFNGLDSICIVICDDGAPTACDTAMIYVNVVPVNNNPSVNDSIITVPEDSTITVCLPIADVDVSQTFTVSSCGDPVNGSATMVVNGNQVCITYTPAPNFFGNDSLCFIVCDDGTPSGCDTAMVYIVVTPVNDAPNVNDTTVTTQEDSTITVCMPITDIDSQNFTVTSCGEPINGTATLEVNGGEVCVTYVPNADFNGLDSLCLVVCDDGNPTLCDTAMVYITVTPMPDDTVALVIPQGFSPNGDGKNDVFQILGLEKYPDNDIQIFNRWGNVVFSTKAYQNDWDGRSHEGLRLGGDALPVGTYYYTLRLSSDMDVIKGFIYLTR